MSLKKYTSGFCSSCHKNVPHRRWIGHPVLLVLDLLTLRIGRLLRIGPWYCVHCDRRATLLPLRRPDAIDYRSAALGNEIAPEKRREKVNSNSSEFEPAELAPSSATQSSVQAELEPAESVGNFIKTDSSLLMKSTRLQRYSEKYRDAVVRRILTRSSSIKQVREEKQLSESEITDWIADFFQRQQEKIDALELFKKSIAQSQNLVDQTLQDFGDQSGTVSGQVRPR